MASENQRDDSIRAPQPEAAVQDARNAAIQQQVHEDSEANRQEAVRVRTSTPSEVSEKTVAEIAEDAEARARR